MTSYQSKYKTDAERESLEDRFMDDMETNHKELFDNLKMAGEGKLDHRDAPWNTEDHKKIHFTSEDESSYEYRLDPESAAGKIFNSLSELRTEATSQEKEIVATRLIHEMTAPVEHAISEFHDPDTPPNDSIPSMADNLATRMSMAHQEVYEALSYKDEDEFIAAVTGLQHLSNDAHLLKTVPGYNPSFMDSLQELDPELADELQAIKTRDGNDPAPSWMDSDHASRSRDEIYDAINNREIPQDGTGYSTAEYYRTVTTEVAEHISQPVLDQVNAFKDENDKNYENYKNDPINDPNNSWLESYLDGRLDSIQSLIEYGLQQRDRDIYNQAMENLIRLNGEVELIRAGEVPKEDWDDGSRYNDLNLEQLASARDRAEVIQLIAQTS